MLLSLVCVKVGGLFCFGGLLEYFWIFCARDSGCAFSDKDGVQLWNAIVVLSSTSESRGV